MNVILIFFDFGFFHKCGKKRDRKNELFRTYQLPDYWNYAGMTIQDIYWPKLMKNDQSSCFFALNVVMDDFGGLLRAGTGKITFLGVKFF